jgi:hypothetical protein
MRDGHPITRCMSQDGLSKEGRRRRNTSAAPPLAPRSIVVWSVEGIDNFARVSRRVHKPCPLGASYECWATHLADRCWLDKKPGLQRGGHYMGARPSISSSMPPLALGRALSPFMLVCRGQLHVKATAVGTLGPVNERVRHLRLVSPRPRRSRLSCPPRNGEMASRGFVADVQLHAISMCCLDYELAWVGPVKGHRVHENREGTTPPILPSPHRCCVPPTLKALSPQSSTVQYLFAARIAVIDQCSYPAASHPPPSLLRLLQGLPYRVP